MHIICLQCGSPDLLKKSGFYIRKSDQLKVQRYFCKYCKIYFSNQSFKHDYRQKKREINQPLFRMISKGFSQRTCAFILRISKETVARRVTRFGCIAKRNLEIYRAHRAKVSNILFDEMESFEHTKCKPLTIPIAVEEKTRKILCLEVGTVAAKGKLAHIARKKYGFRKCERRESLETVLRNLTECAVPNPLLKTDKSQHYPKPIKKYFKDATHQAFKGRRGCVVGQGELKQGGYDPLFTLNHTHAMIRDNVKRLSRKTWCTTKKVEGLRNLLYIYAWFHNLRLDNPKIVKLRSLGAIV